MTGPTCTKCGEPWLDHGHVCNELLVAEFRRRLALTVPPTDEQIGTIRCDRCGERAKVTIRSARITDAAPQQPPVPRDVAEFVASQKSLTSDQQRAAQEVLAEMMAEAPAGDAPSAYDVRAGESDYWYRRAVAAESALASAREALAASIVAIDDWLHCYACEMCDEQYVQATTERIAEQGGTLAYIARVQKANRSAIAGAKQGEGNG